MFICGFILASLSGCNIVSAGSYVLHGPAKLPAQFTLPEKRIVVFVDDRANRIPRSRLRQHIAMKATVELQQVVQVVPEAIDPVAVSRIVTREDAGHLLPIDEIGRRVEADVVIYAEVMHFALVDQGEPRPIAIFEVKVIDVETGQRLWPGPTESPSHTLTIRLAPKTTGRYDPGRIDNLWQTLADMSGLRLAQLFFKHEVNPLDGRVPE